jgi:hypothetical protein
MENGGDWLAPPRPVCTRARQQGRRVGPPPQARHIRRCTQYGREEGKQSSVAMAVSEGLCAPAPQAHCGAVRSVM